ncbi:hypothetical protein GEU84_009915 [Fertoebacter nigrum]|uniref:MFS transporter n=2 Tax=Fertoeibacter niger TaxID=2656921 RepID=A0A8X8GZG1_9RHOB|nr:hypothetical protein [Fertoeibacter niger]NUB44698.1 hypothetical protein [Fertoeibacter niger]
MPVLRLIWHDPTLRLVTLAFALLGAFACTFAPYQSLIAVERLGLSDAAYALVLVLASVLGVSGAIAAGIITDQRANRRQMALGAAILSLAGTALMWAAPGPWGFVLAHAVILPLGGSLFGQIFALSRLAAGAYPAQRDSIQSAVRAVFALPFVIVLPLWSLAFSAGVGVMAVYPAATLLALGLLALIWRFWPQDGRTVWADPKSGLSFVQSLAEMANRRVLIRVVLLGAVNTAVALYMVLIGLVFHDTPGRDEADVALFVGLVAGLEVPFMLAMPLALRLACKTVLIAAGAALYAAYLIALPLLAASPLVWLLTLPCAIGGAAILALPIAYLQDLMAARPGAGSSLMALQRVVGDGFCATAFAIGTFASGYGLAAVLGGACTLAGGLGLLWVDRRRGQRAQAVV